MTSSSAGPARRRAVLIAWLAAVCLSAGPVGAQESEPTRPQPELRLDAIDLRGVHHTTLQLGAGAELPMGYYARLGIIGAGGVTRSDDRTLASGRADVIVRFLLDPFDESRLGLSLGGGLSVQHLPGSAWREYLAVVLDLEWPRIHDVIPAVQVGLGGGLRVGVALRQHEPGRR